ncbi:hypothetical protein CI610_02110 [invertebrate metagenome]|uniref:Uncharacterized protein n=1 Tax=invertebrate metagenome TaxID=1711999 RepID=A0A2H9T6V3_9ZZZZ
MNDFRHYSVVASFYLLFLFSLLLIGQIALAGVKRETLPNYVEIKMGDNYEYKILPLDQVLTSVEQSGLDEFLLERNLKQGHFMVLRISQDELRNYSLAFNNFYGKVAVLPTETDSSPLIHSDVKYHGEDKKNCSAAFSSDQLKTTFVCYKIGAKAKFKKTDFFITRAIKSDAEEENAASSSSTGRWGFGDIGSAAKKWLAGGLIFSQMKSYMFDTSTPQPAVMMHPCDNVTKLLGLMQAGSNMACMKAMSMFNTSLCCAANLTDGLTNFMATRPNITIKPFCQGLSYMMDYSCNVQDVPVMNMSTALPTSMPTSMPECETTVIEHHYPAAIVTTVVLACGIVIAGGVVFCKRTHRFCFAKSR